MLARITTAGRGNLSLVFGLDAGEQFYVHRQKREGTTHEKLRSAQSHQDRAELFEEPSNRPSRWRIRVFLERSAKAVRDSVKGLDRN